ncbi:DNA ligase D [Anaeromyxobacter oryzisoli]|uniref:DNA ligase D n=1 Tax=Anaeromyxobacter oryzisoli TaxID=2925408 RepID=UPI001F578193|nr:DNA ligase D [Anaeromyxobacter sp. SG63]
MAARARASPYEAQLATLVSEPPGGEGWVHEVKYDGYRIGAALEGGRATLWSRRGKDWTAQFPEVARAVETLPARSALLDGEVAAVLDDGRTSFQALQNAFSGGPRRIAYFVFDLLELDGASLAARPLLERKAALERLLGDGCGVVQYAPHVVAADGAATLRAACRAGLEGIVSKRADAPYRPGRNTIWVKAKCVARQEAVIGGFTEPEGAAREGLGALLVGVYEGGALRFAGKVGTGFTNAVARALRARLDRLAQPRPPFSPAPAGALGRLAHWVKPELVAEVAFTEWTSDGKIRHPSFQGLREDKRPEEVVRERPGGPPSSGARPRGRSANPNPTSTPTSTRARHAGRRATGHGKREAGTGDGHGDGHGDGASTPTPDPRPDPPRPRRSRSGSTPAIEIGGVRITHPDRVMFPEPGLTKADVVRYYAEVAPAMIPHLAGRPLTLYHCPEGLSGECRFLKHAKQWAPPAVRRVAIREKTKLGEYLVVDTPEALLSIAQMDILELHTWSSTTAHLEQPDRIVLDLDPGPEVAFPAVVAAARLVREALAALGLGAFVKTTGGAGLHVVTPLVPTARWERCLAFARALAVRLAHHAPRTFTASFAKAGRERKILVDYLRNNRTNTAVAAFSVRARPGAPVSTPVAWDELGKGLHPDHFTVRTVPRRLAHLRADPWAGYAAAARPLSAALLAALAAEAPRTRAARGRPQEAHP